MSFASSLTAPSAVAHRRAVWVVLGHLLLWTWVGISSRSNLDLPGDMVETYVWAQGWQWGYFKHPPLAAWVAGLWFSLFPETDAAFSLLAACTAATGLAGLAVLAREFLPANQVWKVLALAALTPGLGSLALRFNCNSVLVAVWPWATAFFVRAMQRGRSADALACGLACGLAMLGKYFSGVLLLSLVAAALWLPAWRSRLRSQAGALPLLALLAFALSFGPHLVWLLGQTQGPLQYAQAAAGSAAGSAAGPQLGSSGLRALNFALSQYAFLWIALAALAVALVGAGRWRVWLWAASSPFKPPATTQGAHTGASLWILAVAPVVATMLATVLTGARTASVWGLPMACSLTLLLVFTVHQQGGQVSGRRLAKVVLVLWLVVAVGSPLWWQSRARKGAEAVVEPRQELTHAVQQLWNAQFPGAPFRFVTGTRPLAASISFYSKGQARYWSGFDRAVETPWVWAVAVQTAGTALVCGWADNACQALGQTWGAKRHDLSVHKTTRGATFAAQRFAVYLQAPTSPPAIKP